MNTHKSLITLKYKDQTPKTLCHSARIVILIQVKTHLMRKKCKQSFQKSNLKPYERMDSLRSDNYQLNNL